MTVIQAIEALLYDHDTVIVPGLGAFVRRDESAQVNVITNEFQKPTSSLDFDPALREENRLVIEYLMQHDNITEEDARQRIAAFVADGYSKMREGKPLVLEGIGALCHNALGELTFEPDLTADFNADAFGLSDLNVQPVFGDTAVSSETSSQTEPSELKPSEAKPAEAKQPAKKGPDLVQVELLPFRRNKKKHGLVWLWILLLLLLGAAAVWYFMWHKPLPPTPPEPIEKPVTDSIVDAIELPIDSNNLVIDISESNIDTVALVDIVEEPTQPVNIVESQTSTVQVVKPQPESKAFIVGGCFSIEKNALNMVTEAKGQGCTDAFVMQRGSMYYVCYGQYPSTADAKAALPEVLAAFNPKAWILTK